MAGCRSITRSCEEIKDGIQALLAEAYRVVRPAEILFSDSISSCSSRQDESSTLRSDELQAQLDAVSRLFKKLVPTRGKALGGEALDGEREAALEQNNEVDSIQAETLLQLELRALAGSRYYNDTGASLTPEPNTLSPGVTDGERERQEDQDAEPLPPSMVRVTSFSLCLKSLSYARCTVVSSDDCVEQCCCLGS